jgi:5-methylcytosine-specific restriction protein A
MLENKDFSVKEAYDYLNSHGLELKSDVIKKSTDNYYSATTRLKRAKIIELVKENNLLENFCGIFWPLASPDKVKRRIKYFDELMIKWNNSMQERKATDDYTQTIFNTSKKDIEALSDEETMTFSEGTKGKKLVNFLERNPKLRAEAILIHGTICKICSFDFTKKYGPHGKDFIEVHHLVPLHSLNEATLINPKTDMTVLCANCHRMIHRKKDEPLSVEELKKLWEKYHS